MKKDYIYIPRNFINWEWYSDTKTTVLYIHFLLRAEPRDKRYKNLSFTVPKGSFVASLESLVDETGMSEADVKQALENLTLTGYVTRRMMADCSLRLYTVINYDRFLDPYRYM